MQLQNGLEKTGAVYSLKPLKTVQRAGSRKKGGK